LNVFPPLCCTSITTGTIDVSKDNPQSVTWAVSGCSTSDGSELTYTWEEGVTANGASATKSISTGGTHSPMVTVTAESGTHVYRLDYHGNTVCEVEYVVE